MKTRIIVRQVLALCFLIFFYGKVKGQFLKRTIIACEVCSPSSIHSADLDSDGNIDVLFASSDDHKIAWYRNKGTGTFSEQKTITTETKNPRFIYTSDLDNDGDIDVLSASRWDDKIAWYANDGKGNFSGQKIITIEAEGAIAVYSADLDNDEDMDVLSASWSDNKIAWYENDGKGSFSEQKIISTTANQAIDVHAVDLDNDGDTDVISASSKEDKIVWYANDGKGNFSEEKIITVDIVDLQSVYSADLDNDGDMDVLCSNSVWDRKIVWYTNDGKGNFSEKIIATRLKGSTPNIYALDIDHDGDEDIISSFGFSGTLEKKIWYKNDGNGNFVEYTTNSIRENYSVDVHGADIDSDGYIDLFFISLDDIGWYKNDGLGNFDDKREISTQADNPSSIDVGDLNNDGCIDIVATSSDHKISWYPNNGCGSFSDQKIITIDTNEPESIHTADLDNDGDMDVLSVFFPDGKMAWYENKGDGSYSQQNIITQNVVSPRSVYSTDLDNDGDMDVLSASASIREHEISWYENDGTGNFSTRKTISNQVLYATDVYAADLDNDGDIDVLSASRGDNKIAWYENDGTGVFSNQKVITLNAIEAESVFAIDLDQDRDIDVLSASSGDDKIAWYENDGVGGFSDQKIITVQTINPTSIYAADLDQDGDIDIISNSFWYENNGVDSFYSHKITPRNSNWTDVIAADLNHDDKIDIISSSLNRDEISWYENLFEFSTISGITFWDKNGNGVRDSLEDILRNFPVELSPLALSSYTDANGIFHFFVVNDTLYNLSVGPDNCWEASNNIDRYEIQLFGNVTSGINFGFKLISNYQHTQTRINSLPTRCGFTVPFTLSIFNDGCIDAKGKYGIVLDSLVTLKEISKTPDAIKGDTLFWNHETLSSSESEKLTIWLEISGADFIGEIIQMTGLSYIEDEQGELELSSTYEYRSEIRCAYDPNDKLVHPNRAIGHFSAFDQNYTLFDESMEYTIRFQNTGNDTAFNVVIKDYLDVKLDWTTFKPIIASHPFETLLYKDGLVEFSFKNILLPDSTTNEPFSHGFITYKISPKKGLAENTIIENTASIFFDFNPPIITNTTQNVMVSEFPKTTSTKDFYLNQAIKVYPNPFGDFLTIEKQRSSFDISTLSIFDVTGRELKTVNLQDAIQQISTSSFGRGLYIYQVKNTEGQMIANGKLIKQ